MLNDYQQPSMPSIAMRHKVKPSLCCSPPWFMTMSLLKSEDKPRTPWSPYAWLKLTALELPKISYRCKNPISWIDKAHGFV